MIKKLFGLKTTILPMKMAEMYWELCKKFSSSLHQVLSNHHGKEITSTSFMLAEIIYNLWIISHTLSADKDVLAFLHHEIFIKRFVKAFSISQESLNKQLMERYKEYYHSWNEQTNFPDKTNALSFVFLKNCHQEVGGKEALNAMLSIEVTAHTLSVMQCIQESREGFVVTRS